MKYSLDKYKFYTTKNIVIAASTYCGKIVKGVAKADPRDTFDMEKGKTLAAARCNAKIAGKRQKRANKKLIDAQRQLEAARKHYQNMSEYYDDSEREYQIALNEVAQIEKSM